jgi:hypothetical protein
LNDIEGSIDVYDKKKNIPIEFKTCRSDHIDKPRSFQEEQLRYYMSMQSSTTGYMMYQCLMQFGGSPWRQFKITMNENQQSEQLKKLVREIISLQSAIKEKDPSLARDVFSDRELNWLCRECPYAKECEKMRATVEGAAA